MAEQKKTKPDPDQADETTQTPPTPIAPVATAEPKRGLYRPTRNWRCGFLYLEGQDYPMDRVPADVLAEAVASGHLEEV